MSLVAISDPWRGLWSTCARLRAILGVKPWPVLPHDDRNQEDGLVSHSVQAREQQAHVAFLAVEYRNFRTCIPYRKHHDQPNRGLA